MPGKRRGHGNAAVPAAGAADGDREAVLSLFYVQRQQILYHVRELVHENVRLLKAENIVPDRRIKAA